MYVKYKTKARVVPNTKQNKEEEIKQSYCLSIHDDRMNCRILLTAQCTSFGAELTALCTEDIITKVAAICCLRSIIYFL
jgi:hypothetical protein